MSHPIPQEVEDQLNQFENRFVDVQPEEIGSRWKGNPDEVPEWLRQALLSVYNSGREQKKFLYVIELWSHYGPYDNQGYFLDEKEAYKAFEAMVKAVKAKHRADKSLAKQEDLERKTKNGVIEKVEVDSDFDNDKGLLYKATISYFYKCSYKYDEWDLAGDTYRLKKVELPFNALSAPSSEDKALDK